MHKQPDTDYLPEFSHDRTLTKIQHFYDFLKSQQTSRIDPKLEDTIEAYEKLFADILCCDLI